MVTRLCTCAGKLRKLVSSPKKPWMKTNSSRRLPAVSASGTSDWVDEDRGSRADIAVCEE